MTGTYRRTGGRRDSLFFDIHVPEEDSPGLAPGTESDDETLLDVAVMRLPHIANFDDFDPLRHEPAVRVRYVPRAADFGDPDLVVIPGSKTTVADLDWLRTQDLAERVLAAHRSGTPLIGICAGYQMLGDELLDPDRVESSMPETDGLGLLPISTTAPCVVPCWSSPTQWTPRRSTPWIDPVN